MTPLDAALRVLDRDLRGGGIEYALVGGLAVAVRAEPRLTRDVDVAITTKTDADAEDIVNRLVQINYRPMTVLEQEVTGRLATVRLVHPDRPTTLVDLLFASSGIEPEIVRAGTSVEVLPNLTLRVAKTGHLIAMKLLARDDRRRATDADDLVALSEVAEDDDWDTAQEAVRLITERGYARDRDLISALAELRQ